MLLESKKKKMVAASLMISAIITTFLFLLFSSSVNGVVMVSGEDAEGQRSSSVVENFRVLLRFYGGISDDFIGLSLSPAPAPSPESPAPSTEAGIHPHYRHPRGPSPKTHEPDQVARHGLGGSTWRTTKNLVTVIVPSGIIFVALGVLFYLYYRKKTSRKVQHGKRTVFSVKKSRVGGARSTTRKVSVNSGLNLHYLESLGIDLEQQRRQQQEPKNAGADHGSDGHNISPSTREIMSVHEDVESVRSLCSSPRNGVVAIEDHRSSVSGEESFHSIASPRLSNASVDSSRDGTPATMVAPPPPPPRPPPPPPQPRPSYSRVAPKVPALSSPKSAAPGPPLIPPPPCPPPAPFLKGVQKGGQPPPPPLSGFPESPPLGKNGSPLPKLKALHWDKVRATPDRTMVWDKLRTSSFELDEEMIESLFGYNLHNPMKPDEGKSRTPSPTKHVLDPKRLQNITILSKALNGKPDQVCDALIQGNGLSQQQLEAIRKMVPTKEEEAKLNSYKGDINELGSVEKFVKSLLGIPFALQRIEAMLYRETFDDEILHLSNSFSMLEEACKELRSSRLFLKLLEAVLKTGNRMNIGTIRGGAKAFKLDALLRLADIKGTDGKTTLLHFVVQEIVRSEGIRVSDSIMGKIDIQSNNRTRTVEEKEEDYRRMGLDLVTGLSTELYNVKKTATIDLDALASSVSNLSEGMSKLRSLISGMDDRGKGFVQSMRSFLGYAEKSLRELKEEEDRVLLHVKEIAEYFHGETSKDESRSNPLRIFVIVRDFMGMLDHVCKELRSSKGPPGSPNPLAPFK